MGKVANSDWTHDYFMGYYDEDAKNRHKMLQDRYAIKPPKRSKMDGGSFLEDEAYAREYGNLMNAAVNNDYDIRRQMEARALAGDEAAAKFAQDGIKDFEAAMGALDNVEEYAKLHGVKKLDSDADFAQLSMQAVRDDRAKQEANLVSKDFLDSKIAEMQEKFNNKPEEASQEIVKSAELSAAEERLKNGYSSNSNDSIFKNSAPAESPVTAFRKENASAPASNDQANAVGSYLAQYKEDVKKGANLQPNFKSNLGNAIQTVSSRSIG